MLGHFGAYHFGSYQFVALLGTGTIIAPTADNGDAVFRHRGKSRNRVRVLHGSTGLVVVERDGSTSDLRGRPALEETIPRKVTRKAIRKAIETDDRWTVAAAKAALPAEIETARGIVLVDALREILRTSSVRQAVHSKWIADEQAARLEAEAAAEEADVETLLLAGF